MFINIYNSHYYLTLKNVGDRQGNMHNHLAFYVINMNSWDMTFMDLGFRKPKSAKKIIDRKLINYSYLAN